MTRCGDAVTLWHYMVLWNQLVTCSLSEESHTQATAIAKDFCLRAAYPDNNRITTAFNNSMSGSAVSSGSLGHLQSMTWLSEYSLRRRGPRNCTTDIQAVFVSDLTWRGIVFCIRYP